MDESLLLLTIGSILAASMVVAIWASKIGVPSLVAFLALGMLLGSDGIGQLSFVDAELARIVGIVGLAAILFEGGLTTSWRRLRQVAVVAASLSTIGVALTATLAGCAAHFLFNLPWLESFLLGAVISSTDAAAVFASIRYSNIRRRLARALEAETGGNDPMAIALTIGLIAWIQQPTFGFGNLGLLLIQQLGIGLVVGVILGLAAMRIFSKLPNNLGAFAPVASLSACFLSYGAAAIIGGSGFLAVYLVGLAIGSTPSRYRRQLVAFHEGLAFLAQVILFIVLGLLVLPHELMAVAAASLILAILLVAVIRPVAVWLALPFTYFTPREKLLLGFAGLRGAVPIVMGTFVLSSEIDHADTIFNAVFFVVLISALLQGITLERIANWLKVVEKQTNTKPSMIKKTIRSGRITIEFNIKDHHSIAGVMIKEIGLPKNASIKAVIRRNKKYPPLPDMRLKKGDHLCVSAPEAFAPELEDVIERWQRRI